MYTLIHGSRAKKAYIRHIAIGYTGYDITYCDEEQQAMAFVSRAVAIHVAKSLAVYGNFYPKERGQEIAQT